LSLNITVRFLFILIIASATLQNAAAQDKRSYQFIEPNVSIRYDSNFFAVSQRFSNTYYGTESYQFKVKPDSDAIVEMSAGYFESKITRSTQDSLTKLIMHEINQKVGDSVQLFLDTSITRTRDFSCFRFVGKELGSSESSTTIIAIHVFDHGISQIIYGAHTKTEVKDEYGIVSDLIAGIRVYSKMEIDKEESRIRNSYHVVVYPQKSNMPRNAPSLKSFVGIVTTREKLHDQLQQVEIDNGSSKEIFTNVTPQGISFNCYDKKTGLTKKTGNLVLLNSFGKKVKLPFSFTYVNSGPLR
jgi:hypothetical protein